EHEDTEALAESLKSLGGVLEAIAVDHEVSVITAAAEDVLALVVSKANERGIKIRSIDIREPNLEAVFLDLSVIALRDYYPCRCEPSESNLFIEYKIASQHVLAMTYES